MAWSSQDCPFELKDDNILFCIMFSFRLRSSLVFPLEKIFQIRVFMIFLIRWLKQIKASLVILCILNSKKSNGLS